MLDNFNTIMSLLASVLTGWAIMSKRVQDGIVIKLGLVLISIGFLAVFFSSMETPGTHRAHATANAMVHLGLLVCLAGYLLRRSRRRCKQRRLGDFVR